MPQVRRSLAIVLCAACALIGCKPGERLLATLKELHEVQRLVSEQAGSGQVSVNLNNGRLLTIGIANSPLRNLPPSEKRQQALKIATLAYGRLAATTAVDHVTVSLIAQRTYAFFVQSSVATDTFSFEGAELTGQRETSASSDRWTVPSTPAPALYLVPVGDVPATALEDLVSRLEKTFHTPVSILPRLLFDRTTFDPARSQVSAEELILAVRRRYATIVANDRARVIGITPDDMFLESMGHRWRFTFSLRSDDDHVAVVSYARMDPERLGEAPDAERLATRLRKMVTKNIGVMCYGMPLSQNPRSVLYGQIGGIEELDRITEFFEPE